MSVTMDLSRLAWRKSSRSTGNGGECVEVAEIPGSIAVRDSKNPHHPHLVITAGNWRSMISAVKRHERL